MGRRSLFVALLLAAPTAVSSAALTECEKEAPLGWSRSHRQRLCQDGGHHDSLQPARCANRAKDLRLGLSTDAIIELCHRGGGDGPATCVQALPRGMAPSAKVKLCQGASGSGPAECVKQAPKMMDAEAKADLCREAVDASPALCVRAFPRRYDTEVAVSLCREPGVGVGPAECAAARGMERREAGLVSTLCQGATSSAPATCFNEAHATLSDEQKLALCRGAVSWEPAKCVEALRGLHWKELDEEAQVRMCRGHNSTGPADCLSDCPHSLSVPQRLLLCEGAVDASPASCLQAASHTLRGVKERISLCRGSVDNAPAICASEAPYNMDDGAKVSLCRDATDDQPAVCAQAAARELSHSGGWEAVLQLCRGPSTGALAAACLAKTPGWLSIETRIGLCRGAASDGPAQCSASAPRHLEEDLLLSLCREAVGPGPAQCMSQAPPSLFKPNEALLLCRHATSTAPVQCARESPPWLPANIRAALCSLAVDSAPAACAAACPSCLPPQAIARLCHRARSTTPAYCVSKLLTCSPGEDDVRACGEAVSLPRHLRLVNLTHTERFLTPDAPITATLEVLDQFEQPMSWDQQTVVRAWIDPQRSGGARLLGKKAAVAVNGVANLANLTFDEPGSFTLHFSIGEHGNETAAAARVVVMPTLDEQRRLSCLFVFDRLLEVQPLGAGEVFASLPWPHSIEAAPCLECFESAAFRYSHGWGGEVWLWYFHGVYILETGSGVPSEGMSYYERLDLQPGASRREIRKAYYQKALDWHPDRWAQYPGYERRVGRLFDLVNEAYEKLQEEAPVYA